MAYSSFLCTWCVSNLGYCLEALYFCSLSHQWGGAPGVLCKQFLPRGIACVRWGITSFLGVLVLPLKSQVQKKVFNFHFLRIAFPSERKANAHPPLTLHSISCPRQNVDWELWISLIKIVLNFKKSKIPFLEKPSKGHRATSNSHQAINITLLVLTGLLSPNSC